MSISPKLHTLLAAAILAAFGSVAHAAPKISCESTEHDFGVVDPFDQTARHAFRVVNEGTEPLQIKVAETSCKCTVAAAESERIEPGQSTEVLLEITILKSAVSFGHHARVLTNDPDRPEIEFRIKGKVSQAAAVFPDKLPFFEMRKGQTATGTILVASQRWDSIEIRDATCELDGAKLTPRPATKAERETLDISYRAAVAIDFSCPVALDFKEAIEREIVFRVAPSDSQEGEPVERRLPVSLYASSRLTIAGDLVRGKHVHFEVVPSAKGKRKFFAVTIRDEDKRLAIKKVDTNVKCLKVLLEPTPESERTGVYRLILDIPKGSKPESHMGLTGDEQGFVEIAFDHPRIKPVRFTVLVAVVDEE